MVAGLWSWDASQDASRGVGAAPADPCGHIKSLCGVSTMQCDTEGGDRFWRCELDKLQVRLVLPRGQRAVWAEPEQGTGLRWERGSEQDCAGNGLR